jgi:Protein of unknown function (DUF3102)
MSGGNPLAERRLAEHAKAIRALGKRAVADIIEIGRRLTEAKAIAGHGNWLPWLEREFGWTDKTAEKWMHVYALSLKFELGSNIDVRPTLSALYLLAAPSTPDEVREAVIERSEAGEHFSAADVKRLVTEIKKPAEPPVEVSMTIEDKPKPTRIVRMQVETHKMQLPVVAYAGESKPLVEAMREIQQARQASDDSYRALERSAGEAITALLRFGQAAQNGLDIRTMRARLREDKCEDEFFDALSQAAELLRWFQAGTGQTVRTQK